MLTYTFEAADDEATDPQWTCVEHPDWSIQDATGYAGGFVVTESSPAGEPIWIRHHTPAEKTLEAAKAKLARLVGERTA